MTAKRTRFSLERMPPNTIIGNLSSTSYEPPVALTTTELGGILFTEVTKGTNYTLVASDSGKRIVATAAITITVPALGTLGNGFACDLVNDSGGTVTIDGPGSTNVSMSDGDVASILEVNGKQRVAKGSTTVVS
jgi:hypothetical protein